MNVRHRGHQILLHGLALVLVGLVWGLVVPHTPHPRLALGAHIQFVTNGMLIIVLATLLLLIPNTVGTKSALAMWIAAWLVWPMAISEAANAWWGTTTMLPIAASQAGVTGGEPWQEALVKLTHIAAGLALIGAWAMLIAGFVKRPPAPQ